MTTPAPFRSLVLQLLANDRLSPEEANVLLEDIPDPVERAGGAALLFQSAAGPESVAQPARDTPEVLIIEVSSISLTVLHDPRAVLRITTSVERHPRRLHSPSCSSKFARSARPKECHSFGKCSSAARPVLNSSREGALELRETPEGWYLKRIENVENGWGKLLAGNIEVVTSFTKAMLTVPFIPERVQITVDGGQVVLPKVIGELQATVRGGTLSAEVVRGTARVSVNGGNLSVEQASGLMANVNGGNLRWAGELRSGTHFAEVNGGQATLRLLEGSDVKVGAQVSMGSFQADFPIEKTGRFMNAQYHGQLGGGAAKLACKVAAGQVKVVTQ